MEKDVIVTNWHAVVNNLWDAFYYLEDDSKEAIMFKTQLESLIDRAMWIRNHLCYE